MERVDKQHSCRTIFKKHKILTVPCMYIYESIKNVVLDKEEQKNNNVHNYGLRNNYEYFRSTLRGTLNNRHVRVMAGQLFNLPPKEIQITKNNTCKLNLVKKYLLENAFCSLEEYKSSNKKL